MSKLNVQTILVAVLLSVVISVGFFTVLKDGFVGPAGKQGVQGSQGLEGIQGSQGLRGIQGEQGIQGLQGEQGVQGERGISGYFVAYSPVGEYTEIPGIVNGDFSEQDTHRADGWYTQGRSGFWDGARGLGQRPMGTTMKQDIVIGENQGLAFSVKSDGARLMVYLDGFVLFYGDFTNSPLEWTRVVVANSPLAVGSRELYFVVLHGPEGATVWIDNVTLVEFN